MTRASFRISSCTSVGFVVHKTVVNIENQGGPSQDSKDIPVTLTDALLFVRRAWEMVTQETVANCFRHAGFVKLAGGEEDIEPVGPIQVMDLEAAKELAGPVRELQAHGWDISVEDLLEVDADLPTSAEPDMDSCLPEGEASSQAGPSDSMACSQDSDSEEEEPAVPPPTVAEMRQGMEHVMKWMMSREHTTEREISQGLAMVNTLDRLLKQGSKQTTIHQFFKKA